MTKECLVCKQVLPLSSFHIKTHQKHGVDNHCGECRNERARAIYGLKSWLKNPPIYKTPSLLVAIAELEARGQTLGRLCKHGHDWCSTGLSIRYSNKKRLGDCIECKRDSMRGRVVYPNWLKSPKLSPTVVELVENAALETVGLKLGGLCKCGHEYGATGKSPRLIEFTKETGALTTGECLFCFRSRVKSYTENNPEWAANIQGMYREKAKLNRWLENPKLSSTVLELVAKEQSRHTKYIELREKRNAAYRKRYRQNIEKERMRVRLYKNANPEKCKEWGIRRYRQMAEQSDGTVTKTFLKALLKNSTKCHVCGRFMKTEDRTIEHIIPISKGGAHSVLNLSVSHSQCNASKGNRTGDGQLVLGSMA